MIQTFLLTTEVPDWQVMVVKIATILLSTGVAYLMYYVKAKSKEHEQASVAVLLLDDRINLIMEELQESLNEKLKDGKLTKDEIAELKKEAVEIAKKQAKNFGVDALEEFAPKMFPTLIDIVMKRAISKS